MVAVRMLTVRLVAVTQSLKPIQAILGKKRLFIFFRRKVMQGKVAVREDLV